MAVAEVSEKNKLRLITAQATVELLDRDESLLTDVQQARVASWMPMVSKGEPTKLKVKAWMCHEGRNNNGLVFLAEDLPAAAAKIASPNLLPMDWNHSAVRPSWDYDTDPKAIGVWYKAECKTNPKAKGGQGAVGIEVEGVVWAWAFQEQATEMLAMQQQNGYVEFSMACIPSASQLGADENGPYEIAIEPVFFTLSALNMPPADPDARGMIERDVDDDEIDVDDCQAKAASLAGSRDSTEDGMDENMKVALEAALEANAVLKAELEATQGAVTELQARVTAQASEVEAVKATAEEMAIAKDALAQELANATATLQATLGELDTAKAELAAIEAERATVVRAARWETRFAELPESYRAAFAKRTEEEQARFVARWAEATDAEWEEFKSDLLVGFGDVKLSYLMLSRHEGPLPTSSVSSLDLGAAIAALKV